MRNRLLVGLLFGAMVACGGQATGSYTTYTDGGSLDQMEFELQSQRSASGSSRYLTGVMWDNSPDQQRNTLNCSDSMGSDRECFLPPYKSLSVKVKNSGGCSSSQFTTFSNRVNTVLTGMNTLLGGNGWSITRNDDNATHTIQCLVLPTPQGFGQDSIRRYVKTVCSPDFNNLVDDQGLPGVWYRYTSCSVSVDFSAVLARGASSTEDMLLAKHVIGHGLNMLVGVGESDSIGGTYSNSMIIPIVWPAPGTRVVFSTGQLCRTKYYRDAVDSSPTVFGTSGTKNCDNN